MLSQYKDNTRLSRLINAIADRYDYTNDISLFKQIVMNINSANSIGLDWFGEKLEIKRDFLYTKTGVIERLNDTDYKKLILWELLKTTSNSSTSDIDYLINYFFENRGICHVVAVANNTMRIQFYFEFELTPFERELIINQNKIQTPVGVYIDEFFEIPSKDSIIGFEGQELGNFFAANFYK